METYINKYNNIYINYYKYFIDNINKSISKNLILYIYNKGLYIIQYIYILLSYQYINIDDIFSITDKVYIYYIEFINHIDVSLCNESTSVLELNIKDAILFSYKKTIFDKKINNTNNNYIDKLLKNNYNINDILNILKIITKIRSVFGFIVINNNFYNIHSICNFENKLYKIITVLYNKNNLNNIPNILNNIDNKLNDIDIDIDNKLKNIDTDIDINIDNKLNDIFVLLS